MKVLFFIMSLMSLPVFSEVININKKGPNLSSKAISIFKKRVSVFGINLIATAKVEDLKLLHAANIMAEYLDNNQDGVVDDSKVIANMLKRKATLAMFESDSEMEKLEEDIEVSNIGNYQDLFDDETRPNGSSNGQFDGALEEVLHLITFTGHYYAYPKIFGPKNSAVTKAMDKARGGYYEEVPPKYPPEAWYTYDDESCDYNCMVTEYFYWALTTYLGAQDFSGRESAIKDEWKINTKKELKAKDLLIYKILSDPIHKLPRKIPKGKHKLLKNLKVEKL